MLNKITGIIIWTDQLDIMVHFYKNLLGLNLHSTRPNFVTFDLGGERFNIGTHDQVSGKAKDPYRIMLNFEVDDKWVKYNDNIFGSVGIEINPFFIQNAEKSLKSA